MPPGWSCTTRRDGERTLLHQPPRRAALRGEGPLPTPGLPNPNVPCKNSTDHAARLHKGCQAERTCRASQSLSLPGRPRSRFGVKGAGSASGSPPANSAQS
jgi:hypothetical protein